MWCDPQFSAFPKAIHFSGEVFRELRGVDHQQGFIVGMSSGGGPIEGTSDHRFVIDYRELVIDILEMCLSAWFLRDAHASRATS